jgi:cytochrome c oxidase subunit 3
MSSDSARRHEAAQLGMWLFLASEVMMFGSLLMIAWYYRLQHPQGVQAAVAELHFLLAAGNTAILFTSSLCMSCALVSRARLRLWLGAAWWLGVAFLACKGWEYHLEYAEGLLPGFGLQSPLQEPSARLFINLYFFTTALHGVHLLVAIGLVSHLLLTFKRQPLSEGQQLRLQMVSLYWHLVDAIWVAVFPTLYLVGR